MRKLVKLTMSIVLLNAFNASAQNVGIGTNAPNASAQLDVTASNKGLLVPRVSLISLTDVTTIPTPATGLLVFNTNAALTGGTGFYYNSGTTAAASWLKFQTGAGGGTGNGWSLAGNAGTNSLANFIGTTDSQSLTFRVNNGIAGQIGTEGLIALGRGAAGLELTNAPGVIAIGDSALFNNTADGSEIAIGNKALGSQSTFGEGDNVAIGNFSLISSLSGAQNTAVGTLSLFQADDTSNVAVGFAASFGSFFGQNTAVGAEALVGRQQLDGSFVEAGFGNTAIGNQAIGRNFNGVLNVGVGFGALVNDSIGDFNIGVGVQSLIRNTSGSNNIGIGFRSGISLTTGTKNILIGDSATTSTGALINSIAIGHNAIVDQNNRARIGNTSMTSIGGQVGWTTLSDGRYKTDVAENVKGLDFIMKLRPVTYTYDFGKLNGAASYSNQNFIPGSVQAKLKGSKFSNVSFKTGTSGFGKIENHLRNKSGVVGTNPNEGVRFTGFIAQEVEATAKSIGFEFSGVDKPTNDKATYGLRYAEFTVPLVKAVQEQQAIIEAQNKKIEELTRRLERLENR